MGRTLLLRHQWSTTSTLSSHLNCLWDSVPDFAMKSPPAGRATFLHCGTTVLVARDGVRGHTHRARHGGGGWRVQVVQHWGSVHGLKGEQQLAWVECSVTTLTN